MADDSSAPQPTTIQKLSTAVYPSFAMLAGMQTRRVYTAAKRANDGCTISRRA